jgi:PAS domain S-box-containing protein
MPPDIDRRSKQYLIFRLLIILLGFGLVAFYQLWLETAFRANTFRYLYGLLGAYLVLGIGLLATHAHWRRRHSVLRWQVLCDFFIQSLLVWGTGGVFSIFSPLLFVTLVAATSIISARGAFLLATLATIFLTATTIAYGLGVAPVATSQVDWHFANDRSAFVVSYLLGSILALYAVSTLGSRFSHGLRSMAGIHSEIIENIAEGLIAMDMEGRVFQLNKEARRLLGFAQSDIAVAMPTLESLFPGEAHAGLRAAFFQKRRRRIQTTVGARGAKEIPVEVKISSVEEEVGVTRCRLGLISDLSLEREMERASWRIQKLQDLQVMSLGIAHEIRNPLASIRGCVQEIERLLTQGSTATRFMEIVRRESDRLDGILEHFLQFARPGPVDLVPLDLVKVIEEAALLIKSRSGFGSRTLWLSFPPERPRIFGDHNRLMQVFLNLGLNAIDATSPEDGKISITLRPRKFATLEQRQGGQDLVPGIEVEVSDNGSGIGESEMQKIFTPFFTTKESGNGLGLCIVNRILREHMGVLDVSSVKGQQTVFRLWFPVLRPVASEEDEEGQTGAGTTALESETEYYIHA